MNDKGLMSKIINRLKIEPGIILLHHNADLDSVGSALALKNAFPNYSIGAFQNISQVGKKLLSHYKDVAIIEKPNLDKYKTIVILDTSTPSQLGLDNEFLNNYNYMVIDHHVRTDNWDTDLYYCDETKASCAEIVLELLELINFNITRETALALSIGIIADSAHFKYARYETFINFSRLLVSGNLKSSEVFEILENTDKIDSSQRIAHLKGAQRLKFQQLFGYLIATSILSSYEAAMCKHLIKLGADVAFVGAQRDEQIRISGRASQELVNRGLHLGKFFKSLGDELMCEGGGHDGAGGLNGSGDVEMVLNVCVSKISEILRNDFK
jgi:nanoRNase/pAp phosphatase (c-di-AMP/oligoRNAs hydrolase)